MRWGLCETDDVILYVGSFLEYTVYHSESYFIYTKDKRKIENGTRMQNRKWYKLFANSTTHYYS